MNHEELIKATLEATKPKWERSETVRKILDAARQKFEKDVHAAARKHTQAKRQDP
jgi:hypothetical protein